MSLIVARAYRQITYRPYTYSTQPRRIAGERFQWIIEERKRRRSAEVQASAGAYSEWRGIACYPSLEQALHGLSDLQLRAGSRWFDSSTVLRPFHIFRICFIRAMASRSSCRVKRRFAFASAE